MIGSVEGNDDDELGVLQPAHGDVHSRHRAQAAPTVFPPDRQADSVAPDVLVWLGLVAQIVARICAGQNRTQVSR